MRGRRRWSAIRRAIGALLAGIALGCTIDPNDACPPEACPNAFTITIHRDKNAALPVGRWQLVVDTDLGKGDVTCTIESPKGLGSCNADTATRALLDLGSVTQGTDVAGLYLTVVGNPRRVSLTVVHDGTTLGTQAYVPTYTALQNCGRTCQIGKDTMTIP
jgi:hypothetical protein